MSVATSASAQSDGIPGLSIEQVRAQQNFPLAVIAGVSAALLGAVLWAAVTVTTEYKLGLMALAVGYIAGQAIRLAGQGVDAKFGYLGAACGFLGCAAGDILSNIAFFAHAKSLSLVQTLNILTPDLLDSAGQDRFRSHGSAVSGDRRVRGL